MYDSSYSITDEDVCDVRRVLFVGLACLDIIMVCDEYPVEDSDKRALAQRFQRGGNATNSCSVFNSFQICSTEYFGIWTDDYGGRLMQEDLKNQGIVTANCIMSEGLSSPTSIVLLSLKTGSRTIVHFNNDFPELAVVHLELLFLPNYRWIHFEGRNIDNVSQMMDIINYRNADMSPSNKVTVSLELEKKNPKLMVLINKADVVFIGKDFGSMLECSNSTEVVMKLSGSVKPGAILISSWGRYGASCMDANGTIHYSPSFPPAKVVDSLGAGDTFLASCIAALISGKPANEAIVIGCRVAGAKCGIDGYDPNVLKRVYDCSSFIS